MKKLLPTLLCLLPFVPSPSRAEGDVSMEKIPAYAAKLSARLVSTNLTAIKIRAPFPNGRKSHYEKEELGLRFLAMLEKSDIEPYTLLSLFWNMVDEARTRPAWAAEIRRIAPLTQMTDVQKVRILDQLNSSPSEISKLDAVPIEAQDERPNLKTAFEEAKKAAGQIPKIFKIRNALIGAIEALQKHIIGPVRPGDCYEDDPDCQFGGNKGVIGSYSERVAEDHDLALAVFKFSLLIRHEDYRNPHTGDFQSNDMAKVNIWPLALQASDGDVDRALEAITVYGHDVCCNGLYATSREDIFLISMLNNAAPNIGGDNNPISNLFAPGAMNGAQVPVSVLKRLNAAIAEYNRVFGETRTLRAGYYHLYGGLSSARVLLSRGFGSHSGLRLGVLFPQALGHSYKRLQLPRYFSADANKVWELAEGDQDDIKKVIPREWDAARKEKVLAELGFQLAILDYSEAQHRAGALFAFKQYQDAY